MSFELTVILGKKQINETNCCFVLMTLAIVWMFEVYEGASLFDWQS